MDHPSTGELSGHTLGSNQVLVGTKPVSGTQHGAAAHATRRCTGHRSTHIARRSMVLRLYRSQPNRTDRDRPDISRRQRSLLMRDGGRKRAIHTAVVSNHHPGVLLIDAGCDRRVLGLQFGDIGAVCGPRPADPTVAHVNIVSPRVGNTYHFAWATRDANDPAGPAPGVGRLRDR